MKPTSANPALHSPCLQNTLVTRGARTSLAAALVILIMVPPPIAAQSCGSSITSDLTLTADLDLTGCSGTALSIGADGITIDGQGHRIIAPDASVVILIN